MELPAELYRSYHQRRKTDLERLQSAFRDGDIEPFRTLGHQLKGNAPTYGYPELALLGEQLEQLSLENFHSKAPELLDAIRGWIDETEGRLP